MSAQGIECSYPGRADVRWIRSLSRKKGTEFLPRVPIDSHIVPFCPEIRVISYLRHCIWTRCGQGFSISVPLVPFLLFLAFGRAMPPRLSADTGCGAAMPAQGWSTIHRTHDHIISKFKRLGKRQMSTGCSNVIALAQTLKAGSHSGGGPPAEYGGLPAGR